MNEFQTIRAPDGTEMVVLPRVEYDGLLARLADAEASAEHRRVMDRVQTGEETIGQELLDRLTSGEHPLKVWRTYRGLTQARLGEISGRTQEAISNVERGVSRGSFDLMHDLAEALGVPLENLRTVAD